MAKLFRQMIASIKHNSKLKAAKESLVGRDEYGNSYWERMADPEKGIKGIRRVEPAGKVDQTEVPVVPVEWNAWLRKIRVDAPTNEEIFANEQSKLRTLDRAKELEEKRKGEQVVSDTEKSEVDLLKPDTDKKSFPSYDNQYEDLPGGKRN